MMPALTRIPTAEALQICREATPRPDLLVHANGAFRLTYPDPAPRRAAVRDTVRDTGREAYERALFGDHEDSLLAPPADGDDWVVIEINDANWLRARAP